MRGGAWTLLFVPGALAVGFIGYAIWARIEAWWDEKHHTERDTDQ
jgi:hypothetical protein